jgi:Tol biopolymer transport system component
LDSIRHVWHRLVFGLVLGAALAGCGFRSAASAGGGPGDAAIDGSGDGSSALPGCFGHWMDGSVAIDASTVAEITELSSLGGDDRNPWISDDGLRIFFSRDFGPTLGNGDIYFASRTSPTSTFGLAMPYANLNTAGREGRVTLAPDELTLAISTERFSPGNPGNLQIDMQTTGQRDVFASPNIVHLDAVNAVGSQRYDPFLTPDLLRLYFAADTAGPKLQLLVAERTSATADFGTPMTVPGTGDTSVNKADPTLYHNELLLVFSSDPPGMSGNADLSYATRPSATADFGPPMKIPTVNMNSNELDPQLSADGCELYFASDRDGRFQLFHAQITR